MPIENYYILTSLPALEPEAIPAITAVELRDKVEISRTAAEIIRAIILGDDLLKMQAIQSEELEDAETSVLTEAQVKGEDTLPDFLQSPDEPERKVPVDSSWENYFKYAAETAERYNSNFLKKWVDFEVSLRNALVAARAKKLGFDAHEFTVAPQFYDDKYDFDALMNDWISAANPLAGFEILDNARWRWVNENERWFSFSDDELAAYAVKLLLLSRKYRINQTRND